MLLPFLFAILPATASFAGNVIFITLDGVRREDANQVFKDSGSLYYPTRVSNKVAMSLPGYRSLFAGDFEARCRGNIGCGEMDRETLFDKLIDRGMPLSKLGAFASWDGLSYAIESKPRVFRSIAGKMSGATESIKPELHVQLAAINDMAASDLPEWGAAIQDKYTWALAMAYLTSQQPQFLYIGLLDTDEWAHEHNKVKYSEALRTDRARIEDLQKTLASMGEYGRDTTIVLTTDHGRGRWPFFSQHGRFILHSYQTWVRIFPSRAQKDASFNLRRQKDLRWVIERLLSDRE